MFGRIRSLDHRLMLALLAGVLLLRVILPSGWMPTTAADGSVRISVCTGMGVQEILLDRDGRLHEKAPASGHHDPQPCGFGVLSLGLNETPDLAVAAPLAFVHAVAALTRQTRAIGRGLAAPPPPSTGPPSLI